MTKGKREASTASGEMEPPIKKHRKEAVLLDKGSIKGKKHLGKVVANSPKLGMKKLKASTALGEMEPSVKKHWKEAVLLDKGSIKGKKHLDKVVANSPKLGMKKLKEKAVKGKYQKNTGGMKDEKPDWVKFKKNKKELKKTRKLQKCSIYDATIKAKQLWEKLRRSDCTAENKLFLTNEIHGLLQGHLHEVVFAHDMGRIVQWLLKMGTPEMRAVITEELEPVLVSMLQSKYSAYSVKKILMYGSRKSKLLVVRCLLGHVVKLTCHVVAAPVVDYIYNMCTTKMQKILMQQEFYGDIYRKTKDDSIRCLEDVWKTSPTLKDATLATTKANLTKLFNKKLGTSHMVHTILLDYLNQCTPEDRSEMLVQVRSLLLDLVKTQGGARVAMLCFWHGTNKDRKMGMKALKGHVKDIATTKFGHLLLLAMFDCIDDTVLLKKMLLVEVTAQAIEIASDQFGRRVLLYLVAHRDPRYFHPQEVEVFRKGDMLSNSKKDITVRKAELLAAVLKPLLESITEQTGQWLSNGSICLVTLAVLKAGTGPELEITFRAIMRYISDSKNKITEGDKEYFAIEHSGVHMMLKSIIQHEKEVGLKGEDTFSSILMLEVTEETLREWTTFNKGCFLLVELLKCENEPAVQELQKKLSQLLEHIISQRFIGAEVLVKQLV